MIVEKKKSMHPISEILCLVYDTLLRQGQVSFPLTQQNRNALDSVIKTVNGSYFGTERYPRAEDKAAAYLCLLIKRHALTDGNKRTALLWFETFCEVSNLTPKEPDFGYDALTVLIESVPSESIDEFIPVIRDFLFGQ
jgi:hypothetical protein